MANQRLKNVCPASFRVWGLTFWKVARIVNVTFLWKFKKPISCFKLKFFSLVFSLCFFCLHYFSFALLTITRTTTWQRTHINKGSNINKIINYSYEILAKSRYDAISSFPKNDLISRYLGVTLSICNIQDKFCFT